MRQNQENYLFNCALLSMFGFVITVGMFFVLMAMLALWVKAQPVTPVYVAIDVTSTPEQQPISTPIKAMVAPTVTPLPSNTPVSTITSTYTPQPTNTLVPTSTPLPTITPIPPIPSSTSTASPAPLLNAELIPIDTPTIASTLAWYAGGTLRNGTVAEWRAADYRNKLATAADWAAGGFDLHSEAEYKIYAPALLVCIETAFDSYASMHSESAPMLDLAVVCVIGLKTPK